MKIPVTITWKDDAAVALRMQKMADAEIEIDEDILKALFAFLRERDSMPFSPEYPIPSVLAGQRKKES